MTRKTVGIASLIWGVSILLSRLIGLIRESVIGRTLGGSAEADAYWTAFVLPDFLNYLLAGGALSIVFIPIFSRHLNDGRTEDAWLSFSVISSWVTALVICLTGLAWWATPTLTNYIAPGIQGANQTLLIELIRIILPAQIFHLTGGLISATLQARDKHLLPALAPLVYTGSIILGGLLLGPSLGAKGFAWGVLVGSVLGPFGLPLAGALKDGLKWQACFRHQHPDLKRYVLLSIPVMLGFSIVVFDDMLIKHFGSLLPEGAISRLQYAKTLMKVPMGVFGLAVGVASYPTLARLFGQDNTVEAKRLMLDALCGIFVLALLANAALASVGTEIAAVIWGRTRFSPEALSEIGLLTAFMGLGLWAWSGQVLVARGFYAMGDTWTPTIMGSVMTVAAIPVYKLLAETRGSAGLALASGAAVSLYLLGLFMLFGRRVGYVRADYMRLSVVLTKMAIAAMASVKAIVLARAYIDVSGWSDLSRGMLFGILSITLTVSFAVLLRVSEVTAIGQRLLKRVRRRLG